MSPIQLIIPLIALGIASWWLSHFLTRQAISIAHEKGILAHPNHRSSHTEPTPRIGGLGPVGALLLITPFAITVYPQIQNWQGFAEVDTVANLKLAGLLLTFSAASAVGYADDLGKLSSKAKFSLQWVIAAIPILFGMWIKTIDLPFLGTFIFYPVVGMILSWAWVLLMMNVINFMDGINGLIGRFLEAFGVFLILCGLNFSWRGEIALMGAVTIGAATGFLRYNLDQAKTFLGDTGSQAIGAFVATVALLIHSQNIPGVEPGITLHDPILPFVIAFFPFIFDVAVTLIKRTMQGKNLFQAHREHLYQRHLVCVNEDHRQTLGFQSNLIYLSAFAGAVSFRIRSDTVVLLCLAAVVAASVFAWYRVLRLEDHRSVENQ